MWFAFLNDIRISFSHLNNKSKYFPDSENGVWCELLKVSESFYIISYDHANFLA